MSEWRPRQTENSDSGCSGICGVVCSILRRTLVVCKIYSRSNDKSLKKRLAFLATACVACFAIVVGATVLLAGEPVTQNAKCIDTGTKCTGSVPAGTVTGNCTLEDANYGHHCATNIVGPIDNFSCETLYPGHSCTTLAPVNCVTWAPGFCALDQNVNPYCNHLGLPPLQDSGTATACQ